MRAPSSHLMCLLALIDSRLTASSMQPVEHLARDWTETPPNPRLARRPATPRSRESAVEPARPLAVVAGLHTYLDSRVTIILEVMSFHNSMPDGKSDFSPQFIGFMPRHVLEGMQLSDQACKPTWQPGCYGE